jgi:hypothetical protein
MKEVCCLEWLVFFLVTRLISNSFKITPTNTSMPRVTPKPPEGKQPPACIKAPFRGFGGKRSSLGEVVLKVSLNKTIQLKKICTHGYPFVLC